MDKVQKLAQQYMLSTRNPSIISIAVYTQIIQNKRYLRDCFAVLRVQ